MKTCRVCGIVGEEELFIKKGNWCKKCVKEYNKRRYQEKRNELLEQKKKYREQHRQELREYAKKRYQEKSEKINEQKKKYYQQNKKKIREQHREYHKQHRQEIRKHNKEYEKKRYKNNHQYRLANIGRGRIYKARKAQNAPRYCKYNEAIGCTPEELDIWLESQFTPEMNWDNYGTYWHVDHIRPLCSFDLTDPEQYKAAFNYKNTQPLKATDNLIKGGKWESSLN
jgi:hypothetical protein